MNRYKVSEIIKNNFANEIQIITKVVNKKGLYFCKNLRGQEYVLFESDVSKASKIEKEQFLFKLNRIKRFYSGGIVGWLRNLSFIKYFAKIDQENI